MQQGNDSGPSSAAAPSKLSAKKGVVTFVKTRRFSTGRISTKPFIFVDRERGQVYSSLRPFYDLDESIQLKKIRLFKKGFCSKRVVLLSPTLLSACNHQYFRNDCVIFEKQRAGLLGTMFNVKSALGESFEGINPISLT